MRKLFACQVVQMQRIDMAALWMLVAASFVALVTYRICRRSAVGTPLSCEDSLRVWGYVTDLRGSGEMEGASFCFDVSQGEQTFHVIVGEETILPRRNIRVGQRITVDGLWTYHLVDRLYRSPSCRSVVEAFRITNRWPEQRWIRPALVISGLAMVGLLPFVLPEESAFSKTRKKVCCIPGIELASSQPTPRGWIHWCRKLTGIRHGHWTIWAETGQLLERGYFHNGEKHGRFAEWYRSGGARRRNRCEEETFLPGIQCISNHKWDEREFLVVDAYDLEGRRAGFWSHLPCFTRRRDRRVEETFWLGYRSGPHREWDERGNLVVNGYHLEGRRAGFWTDGGSRRFYLYGWVVEDLAQFRRSDPRADAVLMTMARLMEENDRALARWRRKTANRSMWCSNDGSVEGCRDAHGKQGVWMFPHEWRMEAIYLDDVPVLGCTGRAGSLMRSCSWLHLPPDQRAPTWWSRIGCPHSQVTADLGLLSLPRIVKLEGNHKNYDTRRCDLIGRMGPGQKGGMVDISFHFTGTEITKKKYIDWHRHLARCYIKALRRKPDLKGSVELSVPMGGQIQPVRSGPGQLWLYRCVATLLQQKPPRRVDEGRLGMGIYFNIDR